MRLFFPEVCRGQLISANLKRYPILLIWPMKTVRFARPFAQRRLFCVIRARHAASILPVIRKRSVCRGIRLSDTPAKMLKRTAISLQLKEWARQRRLLLRLRAGSELLRNVFGGLRKILLFRTRGQFYEMYRRDDRKFA